MNPCWSRVAQVHNAGAGTKIPALAFCFRRGPLEHAQHTRWLIITPEVISEITLQMDFDRKSSDVALPLDTFDNKPRRVPGRKNIKTRTHVHRSAHGRGTEAPALISSFDLVSSICPMPRGRAW